MLPIVQTAVFNRPMRKKCCFNERETLQNSCTQERGLTYISLAIISVSQIPIKLLKLFKLTYLLPTCLLTYCVFAMNCCIMT